MSAFSFQDRYRGCLVGLAVGDALGGPLEFMSREQVRIKHGKVRSYIGGGVFHLRPGQGTDDTAMAAALAESMAALGRFDREDVTKRYLAWYRGGPADIGNCTKLALEWISEGGDPVRAAEIAHERSGRKSAGNGALMRCAPLALRYRKDARALVEAAAVDARITHFDRLAAGASASFAMLLAAALEEGAKREALIARASEALSPHADLADDVLPRGSGPAGPARFYHDGDAPPASGFVLDTLRAALWAFHMAPSFEEALVAAVNLGEDADTTGAVTGALAGAYYGVGKIPARWMDGLEARGRMTALADKLLAQSEV